MKFIKKFEIQSQKSWITKDFSFLDIFNIPNDAIFVNPNELVLRVQKKENPKNFLEITPVRNLYNVNVHTGTIQKPSTEVGARWYQLGDKYHNVIGVLEIMKGYGIISKDEYDFLTNTKKFNI